MKHNDKDAWKKYAGKGIVQADFSYMDSYTDLEALKKLKLKTSKTDLELYFLSAFIHESFLPRDYSVSYNGLRVERRYYLPARQLFMLENTVFVDSKTGEYVPYDSGQKAKNPFLPSVLNYPIGDTQYGTTELREDIKIFWVNYHLQWAAAKKAAIKNLEARLKSSPELVKEVASIKDIEHTKAIIRIHDDLSGMYDTLGVLLKEAKEGKVYKGSHRNFFDAFEKFRKVRQYTSKDIKKYLMPKA